MTAITEPPIRVAGARMPALDGLRGTAILLVLVGHLCNSVRAEFDVTHTLLEAAHMGWTGVDLFFVLSGFLITGILYDSKHEAPGTYFKNFYARRALRIFPLYYLALLMVGVMSVAWPGLGVWGEAHRGWQWVYLTNWVQWLRNDQMFGLTTHFWSLAVEEHFYLVWPAFVLLLKRGALMLVAGCAMAVALMLRIALVGDSETMPIAAYFGTPTRMDALAAGSLLALIARGVTPLQRYVPAAFAIAVAAALGLLAIVVFANTYDHRDAVMGTVGLSLLWLFYASVLLLALEWRPLAWVASAPPLRWFGKYSYGMYVWHPIVFILVFSTEPARALHGGAGWAGAVVTAAIAVTLVIGASLLSWHLVEKRFLAMKRFFEKSGDAAPRVKAAAPAAS